MKNAKKVYLQVMFSVGVPRISMKNMNNFRLIMEHLKLFILVKKYMLWGRKKIVSITFELLVYTQFLKTLLYIFKC